MERCTETSFPGQSVADELIWYYCMCNAAELKLKSQEEVYTYLEVTGTYLRPGLFSIYGVNQSISSITHPG